MLHRRTLTACCVCLLIAVLTACAGGARGTSSSDAFYTASASLLTGEDIGLRLVNQTDASMRYNLCRSQLERRVNGQWTRVDLQRSETCPDVRFRLAPTETAAYDLPTPRSIPPGTYRVVTRVSIETESRTMRTPPFDVGTDAGSSGP